MNKLTAARAEALTNVQKELIPKHMAAGRLNAHFSIAGFWQKPNQQVYAWLLKNGYIRLGFPSLRGTAVVLTQVGSAYQLPAVTPQAVQV